MLIRYHAGQGHGGGSSINAQIYTRGIRSTMTTGGRWAAPAGATTTCCPISARPRTTTPSTTAGMARAGPLASASPRAPADLRGLFRGGDQLGIPRNLDLTGETPDGVGYYQLTQRNVPPVVNLGRLSGPARGRSNLTVRDRRAGPADRGRKWPRGRGRACGPRRDRADARGDPVGGRHRVAAPSDAVGHRPGGSPAHGRRAGGAGSAGRGGEPAGPSRPFRDRRMHRPPHL